MIPVEVCEIRRIEMNRIGQPVYPLSLVNLLRQRGMWSERYVAFSVGIRGDESPSEIEMILAGTGKVGCDVLAIAAPGPNCDIEGFVRGRAAIVVYDTQKLRKSSGVRLVRPNPASPSEYVAMVVMPKVTEAVFD